MTYSTGGLIQASDYNGFATSINAVWNTAYGQTSLSSVAAGGTVTATQWSTLNSDIAAMAAHQGTSITSRTNPTAGSVISVLSNVGTDITNCTTNQYNAASQGSQYTAWTGSTSQTNSTGSGGSAWTITFTSQMSFASADAASYFFNAGGVVKIQFSKTSTGSVEDTEWNSFIGDGSGNGTLGIIYFTSTGASKTINGTSYTGTTKSGGSGTPTTLATSTGFAQLSSTPTTIYKQFDSGSAYSDNYVQVNASFSGSTLTFTTTWYNGGAPVSAVIAGGTATSGITFGTAPTTLVTYIAPETTNISNTWGTPTISSSVA